MRKPKFVYSFIILLTLASCRPEAEPLFVMEMEASFQIPAGLSTILTHTFIVRDVQNPLQGYLQTFNVDTSQIASIQAGRGRIESVFGETNYEFVNRVSVWMVSPDDPDFRRELYYLDFNNVNSNDQTIRLLSSASNVRELMLQETFDLEIKLDFRNFSPRQLENRLIFSLIALE